MIDPRIETLAKNLVHYSVDVKPGEKILVEAFGIDSMAVKALVKEIHAAGGYAFVNLRDQQVIRDLIRTGTDEQLKIWAEYDVHQMKLMDGYIALRGGQNINEFADVPADRMKSYDELYRHPVHSIQRVKHTKWVVLRYPNPSMAQLANKSTEEFEDFYFYVCNMDYAKMSVAMDPLVSLMERTDRVRLVGPGTDLSFSIKGIPAIKCDGKMNIPDGEVFTAPVKTSVNGTITFNTPSPYNGYTFENIHLTFRDGQIIEATSSDTQRLNEILDTDAGARYVGEFAIGVNPYILHPMKDILFDEKIAGSFHFTPGNCYDEAWNGNESAVHWDMVNIQRPEYGGGEIWFDDVLIRKDGLFVVPELKQLNPEFLQTPTST